MSVSGARVHFIGAGPGAPDLLTVRGARVIAEARIVIWGAELVMEGAVSENAAAGAELIPWPPATMEEILDAYDRAAREGLAIARLVGGDPAIYVDMCDEIERARELGIAVEIVPGVGALSAASAALGRELVTARTDQALVIASPKADLESILPPGPVGALYMGGGEGEGLQERLISAGWPDSAPCAILSSLTWPEPLRVECELSDLGSTLARERPGRRTMVILGLGRREGVA